MRTEMRTLHLLLAVLLLSLSGWAQTDSIVITNTSGSNQTNLPVSVARVFRRGEIQQYAQASISGVALNPTQCDVKNRWPDGSLKFAIVSFEVPTINAGASVTVTFGNQATGNNTGQQTAAQMLGAGYNFDAQIQLTGTASPTIKARDMLTNGDYVPWLQGPIVTAIILEDKITRRYDVNTDGVGACPVTGGSNCPLHPQFEAWFYPQNHAVDVGVTLENTWASSTAALSMRDQTYSLAVALGNTSPATILTQASFVHEGRSRWHTYGLINTPPSVHIDLNDAYEVSTGAFPDWDSSLQVASSALTTYHNTYRSYSARMTIPGDSGGIGNFGKNINAGGQHDYVGLGNILDAFYFLSWDDTIKTDWLLNASLAGRIPFHYREADANAGTGHFFDTPTTGSVSTQGRVVSINARQQLTLIPINFNSTGCGSTATADLLNLGTVTWDNWVSSGNNYDASHFPSIGFIPYLLTGKYYFLEEVQYEGAYIIGEKLGCVGGNSSRQGAKGYLNQSQLRGEAWGIRTMGYCAFASPDGTPEQAYCLDKLKNNIARWEGGESTTISTPSYSDKQTEYNWGKLTWPGSDISPPGPAYGASPLGIQEYSSSVFVQSPLITPAGCTTTGCLLEASSPWELAFFGNTLGILRNQGFSTTELLKRNLVYFVNVAANTGPSGLNSPYYIDVYRYPTILQSTGTWITSWPQFTQSFAAQPAGSAPNGYQLLNDLPTVDDSHGFQAMCALSYGTDLIVDGYSVATAYNAVRQNHPYQNLFATLSPKWDCAPVSTRSVGWQELANTTLVTSGACPPNYYGGDTFNFNTACPTSITAQSGGFADTDHNQLCVFGEGHNDGYGNQVMCVDMAAIPPAWVRRTNPTIPTNCQAASNVTGGLCPGFGSGNNHNACIESIPPQNPWPTSGTPGTDCLTTGGSNCAPNARHSYENLGYMPGFGAFVHSGVAACEGGGSGLTGTWVFDTNANTWSSPSLTFVNTSGRNYMPQGNFGVRATAWDSFNKLMWVHTGGAIYGQQTGTTGYLFTFDPATSTYNLRLSDSYMGLYMEAVVDPVDHYLFFIGSCNYDSCNDVGYVHYGIIRYDISNPAAPVRTNITSSTTGCGNLYLYNGAGPPTGTKPNGMNIGLAWDPVWKLIVAWPNFGSSVYLFNPAAATVTTPFGNVPQNTCLEVTSTSLGSGPPDSANVGGQLNTSYGTYNRFGYFPSLDRFVVVNSPSTNAYALNLRGTAIAPPPPTTYQVAVAVAGTGSGSVSDSTSPPFLCSSGTCAHDYAGGSNVTLTASATGGSTFAGWSGPSAGACSANTCSFSNLSASKNVTATFNLAPAGIPPTLIKGQTVKGATIH